MALASYLAPAYFGTYFLKATTVAGELTRSFFVPTYFGTYFLSPRRAITRSYFTPTYFGVFLHNRRCRSEIYF